MTASWCAPSTCCNASARRANRRAGLPKTGDERLRRVAHPLRPDPGLVQLCVGRRRSQRPASGAQVLPGGIHDDAQHVGGRGIGHLGTDPWVSPRHRRARRAARRSGARASPTASRSSPPRGDGAPARAPSRRPPPRRRAAPSRRGGRALRARRGRGPPRARHPASRAPPEARRASRARASSRRCAGASGAGGSPPEPGAPLRGPRPVAPRRRVRSAAPPNRRSPTRSRRATVDAGPTSGTTTSGAATARAPSARATFEMGSPGCAPGRDRGRAPEPRGGLDPVGELHLDLAEPIDHTAAIEHRDLVVDDFRHGASVVTGCDAGATAHASAAGPPARAGCRARCRRTRSMASAGGRSTAPWKTTSCRATTTPSAPCGSFTVHPWPVRTRSDPPQRTSRRSPVSW